MILTIDIGNTFAKWVGFSLDQKVIFEFKSPTDHFLSDLQKINLNQNPQKIFIACVATFDRDSIHQTLFNQFKIEPLWLSSATPLPFPIHINNPQTIGADRLANVLFAHSQNTNALILDLGTFLTIDIFLTHKGFLGGIIFPGINLVRDLYAKNSSQLFNFSLELKDNLYGTDSLTAMQSGLRQSYRFILSGFIDSLKNEFKTDLKIFATGGGWPFVGDFFNEAEFNPKLTHLGLYYLNSL